MLGVTACGNKKVELSSVNQEWVDSTSKTIIESIVKIAEDGMMDQLMSQYAAQFTEAEIIAIESYEAAMPELGSYQSIESCTYSEEGTELTIIATIICSERNAKVELVIDSQEGLLSCTTNPVYSFGELMTKAGLNTIMGMGTVFVVLVLIATVIGCFGFVSKVQRAMENKNKKTEQAVDNAVAQIVENEEAQDDDLELVAVIAAAIASYEGAASADGYVVRSIRKIR